MNTWGKRPYSSLPETGSFEELTVKKLKFGDCPISLPTDCPPANGSTLSVDTDGSTTWSSLPPVGVPDRIQDDANTCSVFCESTGNVTMNGAGGGSVECVDDGVSLSCAQSQMNVYPGSFVLGGVGGEIMYADISTTRIVGPGQLGGLQINESGRVDIGGSGLQLILPTSGIDKVLTCLDNNGLSQWRDPAPAPIPSRIQDPPGGAVVECVSGNVSVITPASGQVTIGASAVATSKITLESVALQVSIPSVGTNKVLTSIDGVGNAEWRAIPVVTAPDRIRNAAGTVEVLCSSSDLFVTAGPTFPGYVLTSTATSGICQWQSVLGISVTLGGLANQVTLRNTLQINGNMGTTISNNNNGPGACYITPRPMTLAAIQYDLVSSTTSTVFTIYRNTAVIGTFSPSLGSPLRGDQPFVPVAGQSGVMSQGAFVSVKWTAGTQPNGSLVTLYFT